MAFMTIDTSAEAIKDSTGGNYIRTSGMYEVMLKAAIVSQSPNGSQSIDFWFNYQGQDQMLYSAIRLTNNDGSPNVKANMLSKLAIVLGATGGEINDPVEKQLPIGKGGENKECMVLDDFTDTPVIMRIKFQYSLYDGKVQEHKNVANFFSVVNKATASELVNNVEDKGKQYEKELEYADKVEYKDGLTEEDIEEWRKSRSSGKPAETKEKATPAFGQRRSFGHK